MKITKKIMFILIVIIAFFIISFSNFTYANPDNQYVWLENTSSIFLGNEFDNMRINDRDINKLKDDSVFNFQYSISFSKDDFTFDKLMDFDIIKMKDSSYLNDIGKPMIPTKKIMIALPNKIEAKRLQVVEIKSEIINGEYTIFPSQLPQKIGTSFEENKFIPPDYHIYSSNRSYPSNLIELDRQTDLYGQGLAVVTVNPIQYIPNEKSIILITSIKFTIEGTNGYVCGDYLPKGISKIDKKLYEDLIMDMVINPEDVELQFSEDFPQPIGVDTGNYDYVIITQSDWINAFQTLADWKTKKGIPTNIVSTNWIYNSGGYSGTNQEKIRAFIEDAHSNWGTTFFLLGGDTNVIPYKTVTYVGDNIPTDTYYSDYDDDWTCEVHVGRASVYHTGTSAGGIANFVNKILTYEKDPPKTNYAKKVALFGFYLYTSTYGEDVKIAIDNNYIPANWTVTTVYDSHEGNHEDNIDTAVNNGQNLINHIDHCNEYYIGTGTINHSWGLDTSEVDAFSNGDKQSIWYSIGCWACAYDFSNCIAEHFVRDTNGGGVAFIGNSRNGWGYLGYDDYLSLRYDRYFFRSLFDQNHYKLGILFSDHKNDAYNSMDEDDYNKYIFSELTLLGDPELPIWTENPLDIVVSHPLTIPIGSSSFTVHVEDTSENNLNNAYVCIWKEDEIYKTGYTDSAGNIAFTITPLTFGSMNVTVTKHNYIPSESVTHISDIYEPDNTYFNANLIGTDHSKQFHNFHVKGDQDWVEFNAISGYTYVIETSELGDLCDTVIYLYDADGTTLIDWDDNGGNEFYSSSIEWTCITDNIYYVLVEHLDNNTFGSETYYNLSVYIENYPPNADFYIEPLNPTTQDIIYFNDTSIDVDGDISSWIWDFGDGNGSTDQNTVHQYLDDGTYLITLYVFDDKGALNVTSKQIVVSNVGPVVDFDFFPQNPTDLESVNFYDFSYDLDGTIVSWFWDFGDGYTSDMQNPAHQYADDGIYIVTLSVFDDDGASNVTFKQVIVSNVGPVVDFDFSPQNPTDVQMISFTDDSIDYDGFIISWFWDFGDGNSSDMQNPTHQYADDGIYIVTLSMIDDDDASNVTFKKIIVSNVGPIVDFDFSPQNPTDLESVTFTDYSTDLDGYIQSWFWDFGDGYTSDIKNPSHQFAEDGIYTVTLNVTDDDNTKNETSIEINVANVPPVVNFTYTPINPAINEIVQFSDTSFDLDGSIDSWLWDFGEGNTLTDQNPTHKFLDNLPYNVTLTVTDNDGDTSQIIKEIITKSTFYFPLDGNETTIDLKNEADIAITINTTGTTSINISKYSSNPTGENISNNITSIGKYIEIYVEDESTIIWPIEINIYYTQNDLISSGIKESQLLGIFYWNNSDNEWQLYNDTGVNTSYDQSGYDGYCWANAWHLTQLTLGGDNESPSKVTGLSVSDAKDGKLDLSWNPAFDNIGVDHYKIYRDGVFLINRTSTTYRDSGLTNDKSYSYQVSAVDISGNVGENSSSESGIPTATSSSGDTSGGDVGGSPYVPSPPQNIIPIADAGGPYYGFIGEEIEFDGSGSTDDDGTITNYSWDFGDKTSGNGMKTNHIYSNPGRYNVILTVKDELDTENQDETIAEILVPNRIPTAPFVDGPFEGTQNIEYNFSAVSTDEDNDTIQYSFDWGDGATITTEFLPNDTPIMQSHVWTVAGKYSIKVQAFDNETLSEITSYTFLIDAHNVEDIGFITDDDADGTYDTFHSEYIITDLGFEGGKYLIDSTGDGNWNYTYNLVEGLKIYENDAENDISLTIFIGIIVVILILAVIVIIFMKRK